MPVFRVTLGLGRCPSRDEDGSGSAPDVTPGDGGCSGSPRRTLAIAVQHEGRSDVFATIAVAGTISARDTSPCYLRAMPEFECTFRTLTV